jgi:hypothetical protein
MPEDATPEVRLELASHERRPPARPVHPARPRQEGREVRLDGPVLLTKRVACSRVRVAGGTSRSFRRGPWALMGLSGHHGP